MTSEKNKVILHVEDEPAHATIIRIALQRNLGDINLMQVEDGGIALDYLYRRGPYADPAVSPRPDLMLLDLRMPQLGGFEVLAIIKKRFRAANDSNCYYDNLGFTRRPGQGSHMRC